MKYSFYYRKKRLVPGFVFLEVFLELEQLFPSPSIRPPVFYRQSIVFFHSFGRANSCLEEKSDLGVKEKDEQRKNIEGRIPLI